MRLRRFAMIALLFALLHGVITLASELITFSEGFNLDHSEIQPSYTQRLCWNLLNVLTQPGDVVMGTLRVTHKSSLQEWAVMVLNSLVWGVTAAMIAVLFSRRKGPVGTSGD